MNISESYPSATDREHLFTNDELIHYELASPGQRILNYFIDLIVTQVVISIGIVFLLSLVLQLLSPEAIPYIFEDGDFFTSYGVTLLTHLIYYTICEKAFKGYTLGKLVSGTRAIRTDGKEMTFKDAFLRSLSRLVPFEPFSLWIGQGMWHDRWTDTMVIKSR